MACQVNRKPMPKALLIHPNRIEEMGNLDAVAQTEGKKALHAGNDNVFIYPWNRRFKDRRGVEWFLVIVEEEVGCTKAQEQGKDVV